MTAAAGAGSGSRCTSCSRATLRPKGRRPGTSCCRDVRCPDALTPGPRRATGANSRSPASRSPPSSPRKASRRVDPDRWQHRRRSARLRPGVRRADRPVPSEGFLPRAVVFTSSSGGTHAGLLAGRAALIADGRLEPRRPRHRRHRCREGCQPRTPRRRRTRRCDPRLDARRRRSSTRRTSRSTRAGSATTTPCRRRPATAAIDWAARRGGWLMDRTYSGKGLSGLLGLVDEGRWDGDDQVVFIHTGGWPALFACRHWPDGAGSNRAVLSSTGAMSDEILDVDLLAFENGHVGPAPCRGRWRHTQPCNRVRLHEPRRLRRPARHRLRDAAGVLREVARGEAGARGPGANGQTGYTGLLVETAASSDKPDWKEMLNWSTPIAAGHPLEANFPTAYPDQVLPEQSCRGSPMCSTGSTTRSPISSGGSCGSSPRASGATRRSSTTWCRTGPRSPGRSATRRCPNSPRRDDGSRATCGRQRTATST